MLQALASLPHSNLILMSKSFNRFPGNKAIIISNIQNDRLLNEAIESMNGAFVIEKSFIKFHQIWSPLNDIKAVYPDHFKMMSVIRRKHIKFLLESDSQLYANPRINIESLVQSYTDWTDQNHIYNNFVETKLNKNVQRLFCLQSFHPQTVNISMNDLVNKRVFKVKIVFPSKLKFQECF